MDDIVKTGQFTKDQLHISAYYYLYHDLDQFVFIINSRSGRKSNKELHQRISSEVKSLDFLADVYITEHAEETQQIIRQELAKGTKYFVAIGGDGTVNTLAKNLVHTDAFLGIIPRGSGNGLARHFHMPRNLKGALNRLALKKSKLIDAILINDHWSFNVAGIGFDGYISTKFGQDGKRGMRNYMKLIHTEYASYPPVSMEIVALQQTFHEDLFQLAIANASQYGNNAIVAPKASLEDQLLDITLIQKVPMTLLPSFLLKVFSGNILKSRYVKTFQTDRCTVHTSRPVHFHTDGDGRGISDSFEISVVPGCLNILW